MFLIHFATVMPDALILITFTLGFRRGCSFTELKTKSDSTIHLEKFHVETCFITLSKRRDHALLVRGRPARSNDDHVMFLHFPCNFSARVYTCLSRVPEEDQARF
ncbi:hypothetical protein Mal48_16080 [Thalassoglobus polymorphus]|uniref:Uncharacterized protein n=1 Tax=Thalassoglobus polymorphus TaxID=2527994 RepID=A0A517QL60_9PLAN|nr:hypothetical protein Mal48_16080 [Thalassoglobus polymorphus]